MVAFLAKAERIEMEKYIDITLLPSAEVGHHFLWSKVYLQIHLGLVEMQDDDRKVPVGISLPEYNGESRWLGSKLRLLAPDESTLMKLNAKKWLNRLLDYVHLTQVREVPNRIQSYAIYKRQQPPRSLSKLKRTVIRKASREGISPEEAHKQLEISLNNRARAAKKTEVVIDELPLLKTPFIQMKSLSSNQKFRLFIKKEPAESKIAVGFTTFGLSNKSTVPEF